MNQTIVIYQSGAQPELRIEEFWKFWIHVFRTSNRINEGLESYSIGLLTPNRYRVLHRSYVLVQTELLNPIKYYFIGPFKKNTNSKTTLYWMLINKLPQACFPILFFFLFIFLLSLYDLTVEYHWYLIFNKN